MNYKLSPSARISHVCVAYFHNAVSVHTVQCYDLHMIKGKGFEFKLLWAPQGSILAFAYIAWGKQQETSAVLHQDSKWAPPEHEPSIITTVAVHLVGLPHWCKCNVKQAPILLKMVWFFLQVNAL
jgi:hypothetical protein